MFRSLGAVILRAILSTAVEYNYRFVDYFDTTEVGERERGNVVAQATLQSCL